MSNKKQSSVEWVVEKLENLIPQGNQIAIGVIFEQGKAMHKEEIEESFECGYSSGYKDNGEDGKQYYNETFEQTMSEYKKFIVYPSLFYKLGAEWAINEIKGGQDNE